MQDLTQATHKRLLAPYLLHNRLAEVIWGAVIRRPVSDEGSDQPRRIQLFGTSRAFAQVLA
jgi:hypothetical protein